MASYQEVLTFWFEELTPADWFTVNSEVDTTIHTRFHETHRAVVNGDCAEWTKTPAGMLAAIIVLDQFSRNMFRGAAESFAYDDMALSWAREAVENGFDQEVPKEQRAFFYMPYMHSESAAVHEEALALFTALGNEENLKYEKLHKRIIDRFERYPHRNAILGRESTPEEVYFLEHDEHASF